MYDYPDQDEPYRLNIAKNRHGKTTYIDLEYDECRGIFKSVEPLAALASAMNDFGDSEEFNSEFKQEELDSCESEQDEDSVFNDNDEF